mmetsp:Transcript_7/g.14  ORF Transcript_7/g.14 Transcript_7/m.14 type:complete len:120 (+) Transcript_7:636-995(+)
MAHRCQILCMPVGICAQLSFASSAAFHRSLVLVRDHARAYSSQVSSFSLPSSAAIFALYTKKRWAFLKPRRRQRGENSAVKQQAVLDAFSTSSSGAANGASATDVACSAGRSKADGSAC